MFPVSSLSGDFGILRARYRLKKVASSDLFLRTGHLEVAALLKKDKFCLALR